jgi:uncharacterized protein (TIGR00297 family)
MDAATVALAVAALAVAVMAVAMETLARHQLFPQWAARKVLHFVAIAACALVPYRLDDLVPLAVLVAAAEVVLLWLVASGRLFREEDGRPSWGIALFPLPYLLLLLVFPEQQDRWLIAMPMLLLAVSDALAAVVGKLVRSPHYRATGDRKSVAGSLAFVLSAWAILVLFPSPMQLWSTSTLLGTALLMALLLAALEALGERGRDNLYIPLGAALLLHHLNAPQGSDHLPAAWTAMIAAIPFALLVIDRGWLTLGGALAASLLGVLVVLFQGPLWLVPLALFFLSSTLLGKALKGRAAGSDDKQGLPRDAMQVFSNGGPYLLVAMLLPPAQAHWAMLVSMAVATADTWASEIGVALRGRTYDILGARPVPVGVSGGISLQGTLGGLAGAATMGLLAALLISSGSLQWTLVLAGMVLLYGTIGMLADSLLGASLQARYRSMKGVLSDRRSHGAIRVSGMAWMTNDRVNLLSNAVVTGLAVLL